MKTLKVHISEIRTNKDNPRILTEEKHTALVRSLVTFPKMLDLREIVIDASRRIIGGNMRYLALSGIYDLSRDKIREIIDGSRKYRNRSEAEKETLVKYWEDWQDNPIVEVKDASDLDEYEISEFIIKDNESFGSWDWDKIADEYDRDDLVDWGMDLWDPEPEDEEERPQGSGDIKKLTFLLSPTDYDRVTEALTTFDDDPTTALLAALGLNK